MFFRMRSARRGCQQVWLRDLAYFLTGGATGRAPMKLPVDEPWVIRLDVCEDKCIKCGWAGSVETKIGMASVTQPLPGLAWTVAVPCLLFQNAQKCAFCR